MSILEFESNHFLTNPGFWKTSTPQNMRYFLMPIILKDFIFLKIRKFCFEKFEVFLNAKFIYYRTTLNSIIRCKVKWAKVDSFTEEHNGEIKYGFSIKNNSGKQDFYAESQESLDKWLSKLYDLCIMTHFEEDFVLIKSIDSGKFGNVLLCQEISSLTEFAVKSISKDCLTEVHQIDHLRSEINCMRLINHPNCVKLLRVYEDEVSVMLVMEYLPHGNLLQRLKQTGIFSEYEAKLLMKNIFDVLMYLESLGIVHRDIKLENILMSSRYNNYDVKLADFGLAYHHRNPPNSKCGSPGFMAPEVFTGVEYGSKADVFSVGVVGHILLSGKLPFASKSVEKMLKKNKECKIKFGNRIWKHVSPAGLNFIQQLLKKDPNERTSAESAILHDWMRKTVVKADSEFANRTQIQTELCNRNIY